MITSINEINFLKAGQEKFNIKFSLLLEYYLLQFSVHCASALYINTLTRFP